MPQTCLQAGLLNIYSPQTPLACVKLIHAALGHFMFTVVTDGAFTVVTDDGTFTEVADWTFTEVTDGAFTEVTDGTFTVVTDGDMVGFQAIIFSC